ncbi:MAG: Fic family protein [Acidobacteriota bacterium]|nr:Fic family protein [Acidobacteriota bacterium]
MSAEDPPRHSKAGEAELITDPDSLAEREALNGLRQFDAVVEIVECFQDEDRPFRFRPSQLLHLHRIALDGISSYAGNFRPAGIEIGGSRHQPPGAHRVPELVEDLCEYVNSGWAERSALHLAAYVLWRLNWIHPFTDGNGRTSRAASYMVMCCKLGYVLPGKQTIPDQISENKQPYYEALEAVDESLRAGEVNLAKLEEMLSTMLGRQLYAIHADATQRH